MVANPVVAPSRPNQGPGGTLLRRDENAFPQQAVAAAMAWRWDEERTTPAASARALGEGFTLRTSPVSDWRRSYIRLITLSRAGQPDLSIEGHGRSVFVAADGVLYFADFCRGSPGCYIVALDPRTAETRWTAGVPGVGGLASQYSTLINLEVQGPNLVVYGQESDGRYIELVDLRTGRAVGRKVVDLRR